MDADDACALRDLFREGSPSGGNIAISLVRPAFVRFGNCSNSGCLRLEPSNESSEISLRCELVFIFLSPFS
jgi:hypothetical protein